MGKIKVCILMPSHCSSRMGGAELQAKYIAIYLSNLNMEVHYLCRNYKSNFGNEIVHVIPRNPLAKYSYIFDKNSVFSQLKKIAPDYIYQRNLGPYTGIAAIYCKTSKAKMIFHIANSPDVEPYKLKLDAKFVLRLFEAYWRRYGIRKANFIIGQAHYQDRLLQKNFGRHCDVIMPNISPDVSALDEVIKPDKTIVLWVANIKQQKGPQHFINMAKRFSGNKDIEFHMVGKVGSHYAREIAVHANSENNIVFHGFKSFDEVNKLMAQAFVFVNTSEYEGFPNTYIQAWMNQTPVLSLNIDPDNVIMKNSLGFQVADFTKLVQCLEGWINNRESVACMGRRCRNFALEHFSLENAGVISELIEVDYRNDLV